MKIARLFILAVASAVTLNASAAITLGAGSAVGTPNTMVAIPVTVVRGATDPVGFAAATFTISYSQSALTGTPTFTPAGASPWPGAAGITCTFTTGVASCSFATSGPFANPVVPTGSYSIGSISFPVAATFPIPLTSAVVECTDQAGNKLPPGSCIPENGTISGQTAPTLSALPDVTLSGGTGNAVVTVATAGVATASVALACTIPAGTATFAITANANRTINAPATVGANAPAIGLSCTPQVAVATSTLSCAQTAIPAGAALPALTSTITCPALPPVPVSPTLTYAPAPNAALATVTFPAGAAGATTSTISVTPNGSTGGGSTSVTACAISGAVGGGSFSAPTTTPANGIYVTTAGTIDLACTRAATAGTATLTCTETAGSAVSRVWGLTCPAASAAPVAPTLSALPAVTLTGGTGTAAVTVATAGVATASVALACTLPAGSASFAITANANRTINAPATLGTNAPDISMSCVPQAASTTSTLSCAQTPNPAAVLPALTSTITCPAIPTVPPTLTYAPAPNAALTTVTFPAGATGATTSTITVTPSGSTGGGTSSVTACAITGAAGGGTFGAVTTTPANGLYSTAAGSINLACTRAATAGTATLTCNESIGVPPPLRSISGVGTSRVWGLTCPAATVTPVAPTLSPLPAAVTLTGGTGSAAVSVATAGVATASVALACTLPAGSASFAITANANRTINAPAALGINAPDIVMSCVPQAAITSSTLSCAQTPTPAAALSALTSTITCPAAPAVAPTLTYAPAPNAALTTVTFPAGAAGATTTTISVTPNGSTGGGSTSVTACTITGAAGGGSFGAVTTTPANGVYVTTAGTVNLGCTRGATAGTATLTCTEAAATPRVWGLTCPAGTVTPVAPTLSALPAAVTLTGGTGTAAVTVATTGVATASVALACTIPAGTAAFAITAGANRTINAPATLGANAPAIGLSCTPQAAVTTATLSCAQTETPAGAALTPLTSTITCPAAPPATAITYQLAPGTAAAPAGITFPAGAGGPVGSTITAGFSVTGSNFGAAQTGTVGACTFAADPAPTAPAVSDPTAFTGFAQLTFNSANNTVAQPFNGTCTRRATSVSAIMSCPETQPSNAVNPVARVYRVTCPNGPPPGAISASPTSGALVLPAFTVGTGSSSSNLTFTSTAGGSIACAFNPAVPGYTATPNPLNLSGTTPGIVTVTYTGAAAGTFTGMLVCNVAAPSTGGPFTYNVSTTVNGVPPVNAIQVPTLNNISLMLLIAGFLGFGVLLLGRRQL